MDTATTDETRPAPLGDRGYRVTVVAAYARNRVIGAGGRMPWHVPEDLRHFKALTMGHPVVMGRRTFEAIGRPLPGRSTVVLTHDRHAAVDGVLVCHSLAEALDAAAGLPGGDDVMVIGGAQVYRQALPVADRLELSEIPGSPEGDAHFPEIDPAAWKLVAATDHGSFRATSWARREGPIDPPA
ncbi:MAG: dihydrofolate reductase [Austwickia sp.]|jgi:dihydrofolate reductase|nr:dihydrofolate reductase [Austwickia sp.]MBK8435019.1 dihydrofolate reductase [Austwickia sp.]MBK9101425.1 dihydrofolate reductase [Austwickia sp.]